MIRNFISLLATLSFSFGLNEKNVGNGDGHSHSHRRAEMIQVWKQRGDIIRAQEETFADVEEYCIYFDSLRPNYVSMTQDGNTIALGYAIDNGSHRCYYINSAIEIYDYDEEDEQWIFRGPPLMEKGSRATLSADGMYLATGKYFGGGMVEIFQFNTITKDWISVGQIINDYETGEKADYFFGYSLDLSNDGQVVAIGHPGKMGIYNYVQDDDWDPLSPGLTHIYKNEGNSVWKQLGEPITGEIATRSGTAVSLSSGGTVVAIKSSGVYYGDNRRYIAVYRFSKQSDDWSPMGNTIEEEEYGDPIFVALSTSGLFITVTFGRRGRKNTFFAYEWDGQNRHWFRLTDNGTWVVYESAVISIYGNVIFKHLGRSDVTASANGQAVAVKNGDSISVLDSIMVDSNTAAPTLSVSPSLTPSSPPNFARTKKSKKKSSKQSNKKSVKKSSKDVSTKAQSKSSKKDTKKSPKKMQL